MRGPQSQRNWVPSTLGCRSVRLLPLTRWSGKGWYSLVLGIATFISKGCGREGLTWYLFGYKAPYSYLVDL